MIFFLFLVTCGILSKADRTVTYNNYTWISADEPQVSLQLLLHGYIEESNVARTKRMTIDTVIPNLPDSFDSRIQWPKCRDVINKIVDQSNCGDCWAASATSSFADRLCIATNGEEKKFFSTAYLRSCCATCTWGTPPQGCMGGRAGPTWDWMVSHGLPTGGLYNSSEGCIPYDLAPCDHAHDGQETYPPCGEISPTPACTSKCQPNYPVRDASQDLTKFATSYNIEQFNQEAMKTDIYKYGSIQASFTVYSDFAFYKSGVYYPGPKATSVGKHAIRIVGWGQNEKNAMYWIIANSWNEQWGMKGWFNMGWNVGEVDREPVAGHAK